MQNFRTYKLVSLLVVVCLLASSCLTPKKAWKKGQRAYAQGEYYKAENYFKTARGLPTKPERAAVNFYLGECYNHLLRYNYAEGAYNLATKYQYPDSVVWLKLAQVQQINGKYDDAIKNYNQFLYYSPQNEVAANGLLACRTRAELSKPSDYEVREFKLFNAQHSTFSPCFQGDKLSTIYLTSNRNTAQGNLLSGITGLKTTDIFYSKQNAQGNWVKPIPLEGTINTDADEGTVSFTSDGTQMYFMRSEHRGTDSVRTQIMESQRTGARWSNPQRVVLTPDSVMVAHPAVSPDGNTLYFVSDMKGGFGGKDLWYATKKNGSWGIPMNMGAAVNTAGDEMFPVVRTDDEIYFSSNGREGLGGLDLYVAKRAGAEDWRVSHLPVPINSTKDDFGMCFEGESNSGFLSSNRDDNRGYDKIYHFEIPHFELKLTGIIKDSQTGEPIPLSRVSLVGNDGLSEHLEVRKNGGFQETLTGNSRYIFLITAPDYLSQRIEFTTNNGKQDFEYHYAISLVSVSHPVKLNNVFYDFGSATLKPEALVSLDSLAKTLTTNPKITIEISSHTDNVGSDSVNLVLSQRRAQGVVDYLISKGIDPERLTAVGYGKTQPVEVDAALLEKYSFLRPGDVLDEKLLRILPKRQQIIVNQINRRTEFKVLKTNYHKEKK